MSAAQAPPGAADLTSPHGVSSHGRKIIASVVVFLCVATIAVGLRLFCRRLQKVRLGTDDWLIVASLIFYYGHMASALTGIIAGHQGYHVWQISPAVYFRTLFSSEILYVFTITLSRLSINMLFLRIFDVSHYRKAAYANVAFNISWLIFGFFAQFFRCRPVSEAWDITITGGTCANFVAIELAIPIWGIVCDLTTWILPLRLVWRLQISNAQRLGLSLVFAIGLVVIAMGIVRAVTIADADYADFTYGFTTASITLNAETSLAILCACAPLFKPAWDHAHKTSVIRSASMKLFPSGAERLNESAGQKQGRTDRGVPSSASAAPGHGGENDVMIRRDISVEQEAVRDARYLGGRGAHVAEV